jgi:hypothetical protein
MFYGRAKPDELSLLNPAIDLPLGAAGDYLKRRDTKPFSSDWQILS